MAYVQIWLVRHYETESNVKGIFGDGPLDDSPSKRGELQADALRARFLKKEHASDFYRVICSSQKRQLGTARMLALLDPICHEGLREKSVGEWSGKSKTDIDPQVLADWRAGKILPPGGESEEAFTSRVLACWQDLILPEAKKMICSSGDFKLLVVTSGNPIRRIVGEVLGIPFAQQQFLDCQNCSVTIIRITDKGKIYLEALNDITHLESVGYSYLPGTF